jgi:hypothetical protein
MAKPFLTSAQFPSKLHKKKVSPKSTVIVVATNIGLGAGVNVNGTKGKKPTNWSGTITKFVSGNAWLSDNLTVDHEEELLKKRKIVTSGTGFEDVTVTVTNSTDTSNTVITPSVPTVP